MNGYQFMGEHPFLTAFLAMIVFDFYSRFITFLENMANKE